MTRELKHSRPVPEEVALLNEDVGELVVGLLRERFHREDVVTERLVVVHLDVAVARLRPRRRDAHHQQSVVFAGELQSVEHILAVLLLLQDDLVGRCDEQGCLRVLLGDEDGAPSHSCQSAPAERLFQDVHIVHLGQLLVDERQIGHVGADVDVRRVDELGDSVVGLLQQGSSRTKEVEELLGLDCTADGPEATAVTSSQDETILVVCHEIR